MNDKRRVLNPFELLKEARERWDHFISNKVVYEGKFIDAHRVQDVSWIDGYLKGDVWFEVIMYSGEKFGLAVLIENCCDPLVARGQTSMRSNIWSRETAMFVRVHEVFQVSQKAKFRPIPSIVWLKAFDLAVRSGEDVIEGSATPSGVTHRPRIIVQRELNRSSFRLGQLPPTGFGHMLQGQRPSNMIQRGPEIGNDVANDESPSLGLQGRLHTYLDDLRHTAQRAARYGLFDDGELWIEGEANTPFESIDVYLRPASLKVGAAQWMGRSQVDTPPASQSRTGNNAP